MIDEKKLIRDFRRCHKIFSGGEMENRDMLMTYESIRAIINSQPQIGEWIPCGEKLPPKEGFYMATYRFEDETWLKCHELYYGAADGRTEPSWYLDDTYEELCKPFTVTAWQPMPEPYSPQ